MNSCTNNQTVGCAGPESLIPCCQPTTYGEAAAFRFNLPDCRRGGEQNEYVVFVVPRVKGDRESEAAPRRPFREASGSSRPYCPDYEPPDGCTRRAYAAAAQERSCCREPPPNPKPSSCDFNRWSTEYRSTIDQCARWVMNSDVRCKRRPIYPIQCLVDSPCRQQDIRDNEQCAESQPPFCMVPSAYYQRTCEPVPFKQEVVTPCPTRPPTDKSLPCPKPTVSSTNPTTSSNPTTRSDPTARSNPTASTLAATRRITAAPTTIRHRSSPTQHPQQIDEHCEEIASRYPRSSGASQPHQHCPEMVGHRRPLPRCKMPDSQACI